MDVRYFYAEDGKRKGPVSFAVLRELATKGELKRAGKVWCRGMKEWDVASSVSKLFEDLPPDLETEPASPSVPSLEPKALAKLVPVRPTEPSHVELEPLTSCADKSFTPPPETPLSKEEGLLRTLLVASAVSILAIVGVCAWVSNAPKHSTLPPEPSDGTQQAQWDSVIQRNEETWRRNDQRKAQEIEQNQAMLRARGIPDSPALGIMASNAWYQAHYLRATRLLEAGRRNEAEEELRSIQPYHSAPETWQ